MGSSEKRLVPRKKVKTRMVLRIEGEPEEDVKTYIAENLSENGVFLKTVDQYPLGTKVELRFSLTNSPQLLKVKGEVKWLRPSAEETSRDPAGVGVEFTELDSEHQKIIHDFLRSSL
ncbi:MAG TPA: TIGR02266 family protein [Bdellovibrionota bacterium]|nr:TIGR02266 family protein [Bdellovibrionota bacterium]